MDSAPHSVRMPAAYDGATGDVKQRQRVLTMSGMTKYSVISWRAKNNGSMKTAQTQIDMMTQGRGITMAKKKSDVQAQGVELIDLVIERVKADPKCISGFCGDRPLPDPKPLAPEVIAQMTFPSGRPLPPSLKRWLAFDAGWLPDLGWFSSRLATGTTCLHAAPHRRDRDRRVRRAVGRDV